MANWTVESAIIWLAENGHKFVDGKLFLSHEAGLTALACADFLRKTIHIRVIYPKYKIAS